MLLLTLLAVWLIMAVAPETSVGRALCSGLVVVPARWLNELGRGHVALAAMLVVIGIMMFWIGGGDSLSVAGFTVPDVAAWITTFEIAAYLDLVVVAVTTWSALQTRALRHRLTFALARRPCRHVRGSSRRRRVRRPCADNDDDEGYLAQATS